MYRSLENRAVSVPSNYLYLQGAVIAGSREFIVEQVEYLTRALFATENHFVSLVCLECRIDTL